MYLTPNPGSFLYLEWNLALYENNEVKWQKRELKIVSYHTHETNLKQNTRNQIHSIKNVLDFFLSFMYHIYSLIL